MDTTRCALLSPLHDPRLQACRFAFSEQYVTLRAYPNTLACRLPLLAFSATEAEMLKKAGEAFEDRPDLARCPDQCGR